MMDTWNFASEVKNGMTPSWNGRFHCIFSRSLLGFKQPERGRHQPVVILPGGSYFAVGRFGHCSNMEICKWEMKNGLNASKMGNLTTFYWLLWNWSGQRGERHWPVLILSGHPYISVSWSGHHGNMEICKWRGGNGIVASKVNNNITFSQCLLAFSWQERCEALASYYLAWGLYIPVGRFGHHGNLELCKWRGKNSETSVLTGFD